MDSSEPRKSENGTTNEDDDEEKEEVEEGERACKYGFARMHR